ncbi:MAG TPA: glycoside hydrolase family 16 protein [Ktedonobacteraceae bacterium]|nr:glycoside hydrolase family 16 protein [Ktedonobacteraceae bacterium]
MRRFFSARETSNGRSPYRQLAFQCAALLIVASLLIAALSFMQLGRTPTVRAASWNEIFDEEFNGPAGSGVNTNTWIYDTGTGWGTGEIETMTNSTTNVSLDGNGHLRITPVRDSSGNWTSGRIETVQDNFGAPAGGEVEITASIQQPNVSGNAALGYWPAFWTLGTPYRTDHNWPNDGEIDIMEDVNGLSSVYGTLHCGTDPGGPCNEPDGIGSGKQPCSGCQTGFHTYTEIIDRSVSPEQIRWYLDGVNYFTVSANQVPASTWTNAVDHPFYVILDVAMGGGFPDGVCGCTTPTSATQSGVPMLVDYVRVYTANGSATTPTPTPTSGGGCSGSSYTQGYQAVSSSSDLFWFQPCGWTAGYVILHYIPGSSGQQNVNMTYNSSTARWEYTVNGLSPGETLQYSFTYQENGLQYDTGWYSTSSTPTPTPTPTCTSGSYVDGVTSTGSSTAQAWFQPCGWTAGYVILHYIAGSNTQQNVQMSYNSGTGQWTYAVSGMTSGETLQYSFTYQENGLQYDTSWSTWTHP